LELYRFSVFGFGSTIIKKLSVDVIVGPSGIIVAHALMGEVTFRIAEAVAGSPVNKSPDTAFPGKP